MACSTGPRVKSPPCAAAAFHPVLRAVLRMASQRSECPRMEARVPADQRGNLLKNCTNSLFFYFLFFRAGGIDLETIPFL